MDRSASQTTEHDDGDDAVDIVEIAKHHYKETPTLSRMDGDMHYVLILFTSKKSQRQIRELYSCKKNKEKSHTTHEVRRAPMGRYHAAPIQTLIKRGWKLGTLADHQCLVEHHTETKPKAPPAWKAKRQPVMA